MISRARAERAAWALAALALFTLGVATAYAPLWSGDPRATILVQAPSPGATLAWEKNNELDATFAAWLVARHARTLVSRPQHLWDTEHCAPAARTIALGPPMLTLGVLAVPAWLVTRDPILTYNVAVLLVPILGAFAVFLLVADWTRLPAAGLIAGLLYGLAPLVLRDVSHPFVRDLAWTTFALFFARRWLASGGWGNAAGLGASCAMQLGASSYSMLTSALLAPPLGIWLLWRYRLKHVRVAQLLLVAALVASAAAVVLTPYLELRDGPEALVRSVRYYLAWSSLLPGGVEFSGPLTLLLAAVGLATSARRAREGAVGDPRIALLAAGVLVLLAATGGNVMDRYAAIASGSAPPPALPNLYAWAAQAAPLLRAVRGVNNLVIGVHLVLCILAGFGAAALMRRVPARAALAVAVSAVLLAALATARPGWLGFRPTLAFEARAIRPDAQTLGFYAELSRLGNQGPLLELPVSSMSFWGADAQVSQILASAWHGRRTSGCFGSYEPPVLSRVRALSLRLPDPDAIRELRALGFTTLVLHGEERTRRPIRRAATTPGHPLRSLHSAGSLAAWAIGSDPPEGADTDESSMPAGRF